MEYRDEKGTLAGCRPLNNYYAKEIQVGMYLVDYVNKRLLKHCYKETNGEHRFKYIDNNEEVAIRSSPKDKRIKYVLASELVDYNLRRRKQRKELI